MDTCCFQIIHDNDIITLRSPNSSEKRQWINQIESAIGAAKSKNQKSSGNKGPAGQAIGTLNVRVMKATGDTRKYRQIFAVARVGDQVLRTKTVDASQSIFNQSLIFSVFSLDGIMRISIHHFDKYSPDGN